MSILLSGIEMPRTCYYCRFQLLKSLSLGDNRLVYFHSCSLLCKNVDDYENNRREDCPLVEVPEHHGRLVDLDKLIYDMGLDEARKYGNITARDRSFSYGTLMRYEIADALEDTPVIIDKE